MEFGPNQIQTLIRSSGGRSQQPAAAGSSGYKEITTGIGRCCAECRCCVLFLKQLRSSAVAHAAFLLLRRRSRVTKAEAEAAVTSPQNFEIRRRPKVTRTWTRARACAPKCARARALHMCACGQMFATLTFTYGCPLVFSDVFFSKSLCHLDELVVIKQSQTQSRLVEIRGHEALARIDRC